MEESRSDLVRIRLPTGEHEWVTPEAFNLISEREFQDSQRLRRLRRQRDIALGGAAVALIFLGTGYLSLLARQGQPAVAGAAAASPAAQRVVGLPAAAQRDAPSPAVGATPTMGEVASTSRETESRETAPPEMVDEGIGEEIAQVVKAWAAAWSAQDVDGYLSFYGTGFQPPDGSSRAVWEAQRRRRISSPARIAVTVSDVEATATGRGSAIARFGQGYRAPGYRDWVLKTLEMVSESGRWRIVDERSSLIEVGSVPASPESSG